MPWIAADVRTLADLRALVMETLCQRENLLLDQFPLSAYRLRRGGRWCGVQFALHGPRNVHLSAIWDAQKNVLYCYGTRGERFREIRLTHPLTLDAEAA